MKFGVHAGLWMKAWQDDPLPILDIAADLGFDGVELSLLGIGMDRASGIGKAAAARGLDLTCSTGLGAEADPTSPQVAVRERAVAVLTEAVEITAALGARSLAGVVAAPWGVFAPGASDRADRSARTLARIEPVLAQNGVTLGIEAVNRFETDLTSTAADATAIARATGAAHVGVLLDTFHMNIEEKDPAAAIRATGDALVHFHVSDNDRGVPGSGHFDFEHCATALSDIGYDGWITAEMFVMPSNPNSADVKVWRAIEPDPTEAARQTLDFMQRVFAR
ncbi:MAG TPA: sugar phosphate isomerase/epimerase [Paracoccus sp.]|nr:sugar phosphate isomerase/epimerase [Paracoccus sp. (in: a-proteobacteria)]